MMDAPRKGNQELGVGDGEGSVGRIGERGVQWRRLEAGETANDARRESDSKSTKQRIENPWKKAQGSAGESFQPDAWSPGSATRR